MKSFKLLIISGLLCLTGSALAQDAKITVKFTNQPISKILEQIETQTNYAFIYDEAIVDVKQSVSITATAESTSSVLSKLFQNKGIEYVYKDNTFVLRKKTVQDKIKVKGRVIDNSGEGVIGAAILVTETNLGTISDFDGYFDLEIAPGSLVKVTYLGLATQEIRIDKASNDLQILMKEDTELLDELVVVGYGSVRKSHLTGSVASLKMDELNQASPTLEGSLVGHTPGVEIKQTSGAPGSGTSMRIRGVNSVYSGVEPLYVIDGFPASKDVYVNPSDVASVEVLKDAASAAIYGSRAAGGVVLITTKRGKEGKPKVDLSYQFSVQQLARKIDMMNSAQLLELHKDGYNNNYFDYLRTSNTYSSDDERWAHSRSDDNATRLAKRADATTMLLCPDFFNTDIDVDWQDEVFSSAPMHRINFNLSGGKDNFKYMFSLGYLNQDGIIKPSNHERITSRLNMDMKVNDKLSFNVSSNIFYVKDRAVKSDGLAFNDGIILNTLGMPTMYPVYKDDGSYMTNLAYQNTILYTTFSGENPLALAKENKYLFDRTRYSLNAGMDYRFYKDLKGTVTAGAQIADQIYSMYRPGGSIASSTYPQGDYANLARSSNDRDHNIDALLEAYLTYDKTIKKHTINAVGGYSMQDKSYDNIDARGLGFTSDRIPYISGAGAVDGNSDGTTAVTDLASWSMMSFFARGMYNYDDRYSLSATLRSDGCSRFGSETRWGTFPSISAGWNLSNEAFLKDVNVVSAKLRASWGISGNNNIGNYRHVAQISSGSYVFGSNIRQSYYPNGFTDQELEWEKTNQVNIGIDLGFLKNRINLIANYYNGVTKDLLYRNTVSAMTGSTSFWTNLDDGRVKNHGFDFQADAMVITTRDFQWKLSGNISWNKNKVEGLNDVITEKAQRSQITHTTRNGLPIGSFYGMVSDGIITKEDYANILVDAQHKGEKDYVLTGPAVSDYAQVYVGDVKWRDVNGDNTITEDDRDVIGDNYPDFSYGFSTNFKYKSFSLTANFDGQFGNDVINFSRYYIANLEGGVNTMAWGLDRYQDANNTGDGSVYRANRVAKNLNTKFSTYYVEDGSFFRCTNITLGYTAPRSQFIKSMGISSVHLYTSIDNLFMITKYSGYNPDVDYNSSGNITPGIDFGTYPLAKTWSFGVNLTF